MDKGLPFDRVRLESGWFAGYLGPVQVVYYGATVSAESFARYLRYLADEIDQRAEKERSAILYEIPEPSTMGANQRKAVAEVLAPRRDKLKKSVAGYALVTSSLFVRSILQTIFFFAPPPYPWSVEPDALAGFRYLARQMPSIDPGAAARLYTAGRALALPRIGEAREAAATNVPPTVPPTPGRGGSRAS